MNMFLFTIMSQPTSGVRKPLNRSRDDSGNMSQLGTGMMMASRKAKPLDLAFVPRGVVKPSAEPQSWITKVRFRKPQLFDKAVDVAHVIEEPVLDIGLVGLAHADEVGGQAAAERNSGRE